MHQEESVSTENGLSSDSGVVAHVCFLHRNTAVGEGGNDLAMTTVSAEKVGHGLPMRLCVSVAIVYKLNIMA